MKTVIAGKKCNCFEIYDTKKEAFARCHTIANNTKVYKTDDNKYAIIIYTQDVTNTY